MGIMSKLLLVARYALGKVGREGALRFHIRGVASRKGVTNVNIYPSVLSSVTGEIYTQLSNHYSARTMYVSRRFEQRQGKSVIITERRDDPQYWAVRKFYPYVKADILGKKKPTSF